MPIASVRPSPDPPPTADVRALLDRLHAHGLGEHGVNVARHARAVASRLGVSDAPLKALTLAALLHDVGKLLLPDALLQSARPLTSEEWRQVREHPVTGQVIVERTPGLRGLGVLVRHSHERWDGAGYPDGLAGEAIPLGARIIAVCDAWDVMRSGRPYQEARSAEAALQDLLAASGSQFDPAVVAALAMHVTLEA